MTANDCTKRSKLHLRFYLNVIKNKTTNLVYRVLSGTVDRGRDYESTFLARIVLELVLNNNVTDFKISLNHEKFHPFDDIVVQVETANISQNYAIQLKHYRNATKFLSASELKKKKKLNFNMYFEKLKNKEELNNVKDFKWILFTNRKFDYNDDAVFSLKSENSGNVNIKIIQCDTDPLLKKCFNNDFSYKFQSSEAPDCQQYFDNFFLYTDQPHADQMEQELLQTFQEEFKCNRTAFIEYINFLNCWNKREGKREKLTKMWMKQVIAVILLSPLVYSNESVSAYNKKSNILRDAVNNFNVTLFEEELVNGSQIIKLWDIKEECKKVDSAEIQKIKLKYQLAKFKDKEDCLMLWLLNKCPLVIKYEKNIEKAINLCQEHKFVILYETGSRELVHKFCENFSVFKNLADLDENSELHEMLVQTFFCSLQGKPQITLKDLIGKCKQIKEHITPKQLLLSLNNSLVIGEQENICDLYIERSISQYFIEHSLLEQLVKKGTVVIITHMEETTNYFLTLKKVSIESVLSQTRAPDLDKKIIYTSRGTCGQQEFDRFRKKLGEKYNYHQFKMVNNRVEWIRSCGEIEHLKTLLISEYIKEKELYTKVHDNNMEIFCGEPGIGKTALTKNFKNNTFCSSWTVLISPRDHLKHFREKRDDVNALEKYISNNVGKQNDDVNFIFKILLQNKRVNFIWDGLDEVAKKELPTIMNVINELSKEGFKQCITSRNNLKTELEVKFSVLNRAIKEFNEKEQEYFIRKRLQCTDDDFQNIFTKIKCNIEFFKYNEILSIPLQLHMFTELLLCNQQMYNLLLENVLSLSDLYEHFIQTKFNIYYTEKENSDPASERNEEYTEDRLEKYELAALVTYFPDFIGRMSDKFKKFINGIKNNRDPVGIITAVFDDIPNFLHNSFGEYFAARFLSREYRNIPSISSYLFDETYRNIRFLFDSILAKNYPGHLATLHKNLYALKNCSKGIIVQKDKGGRNPLHLACSWGNTYPVLKVENFDRSSSRYQYKIYHNETAVIKKENQEYLNILEYLIDFCHPEEKDEIYNINSYSYADQTFSLTSLGMLSKKYIVPFEDLKNFRNIPTVLYYSTAFEAFFRIFNTIKNVPLICTQHNDSLLSVATRHGSLKICEQLLLTGYKDRINDANIYGETPLCIASMKGHVEIAKLLIAHGADVNAVSANGEPLLYIAYKSKHDQVAKALIEHGANINAKNRFGETPLYVACDNGCADLVRMLIRDGADVNFSDRYGKIPLYVACAKGHTEVVEVLSENGADLDVTNEYGEPPIYAACENGHVEVVELLIKKGANFQIAEEFRKIPLYVACENGHYQVAKLLIERGANVNYTNMYGENSLQTARINEYADIVELLLDNGAV